MKSPHMSKILNEVSCMCLGVFLVDNDVCFFLAAMEVSESTAEECQHSSLLLCFPALSCPAQIRPAMDL